MAVKNALLVDDSKSARLVLSRLLEKNNLHVDLVESAEDALSYLKENKPDVIFMDHMMPGMDGLEAAKLINTNPDTHHIPVVMCTSKEGETFTADAKAHGAVDVICKPPSPDAVTRVLQLINEGGLTSDSVITSTTLAEAHRAVTETLQEIIPMPMHAMPLDTQPQPIPNEAELKALLQQLLPELLHAHTASADHHHAQLDNRARATENHVAKLQLEMEDLHNTLDGQISKKIAQLPSPSVDVSMIDQSIEKLRRELTQQIDEKISSLAELISASSSQESALEKKITDEMHARMKTETSALEQKFDLRLNQLRTQLTEKSNEEAASTQNSASRTMGLVATGLSVLAVLISVGAYFLQ